MTPGTIRVRPSRIHWPCKVVDTPRLDAKDQCTLLLLKLLSKAESLPFRCWTSCSHLVYPHFKVTMQYKTLCTFQWPLPFFFCARPSRSSRHVNAFKRGISSVAGAKKRPVHHSTTTRPATLRFDRHWPTHDHRNQVAEDETPQVAMHDVHRLPRYLVHRLSPPPYIRYLLWYLHSGECLLLPFFIPTCMHGRRKGRNRPKKRLRSPNHGNYFHNYMYCSTGFLPPGSAAQKKITCFHPLGSFTLVTLPCRQFQVADIQLQSFTKMWALGCEKFLPGRV